MEYWRGSWLLVKGPYKDNREPANQDLASQFTLQVFRSRKRAFESVGLDVRKYPKPEMRGQGYPAYWGDSMFIFPNIGRDGEIGTYPIVL